MMNTNHVNGLTVVSIGTGERLGSVSEILLDPAAEHVAAFAIAAGGGGGLLSSEPPQTRWVSASDVHAIGPDYMIVNDGAIRTEVTPAIVAIEPTPEIIEGSAV